MPNYPTGRSKRRIYFKDNGDGPGQFSWLRWKAANTAGNATALTAMVQGAGNMEEGFDEGIFNSATGVFTWPDSNSQPPTVNGKVVYPMKPHEINTGDFVYGNTGVSMSSDVEAALKYHIDKQTVLILPIVNTHVKNGGDTLFPVQGLGAFYLVGIPGYGTGAGTPASGGANGFYDLVYIGTANAVACLSTPAVVSNTLGVIGPVFVKPRWGLQQGQVPIAYEIIMDVSGSMSWNFLGQGSKGGSVKFEADTTGSYSTAQCESTVEDWRSFREMQDELIMSGTFTLPEIWEEMFSSDVDQISFTAGQSPALVQGSEAVRLASEQLGQIPIVDVVDHFVHVHVIDGHTVTETFDSTLFTAESIPFDLRLSGTEVAHRKGGQEEWKEDLIAITVAFVPKD